MALTINAKTYTADGFDTNSVRYQGPGKTMSVKDNLIQKKVDPKPTDVFSGVARYTLKLARTHALTGAKTASADGSVTIDFAMPVGISDADRDAYCADLGAYIATAGFKASLKALQVNG